MLFSFIEDTFEDYRRRARGSGNHKNLVKKTSEFLDDLISALAPYAIYFTKDITDSNKRKDYYKTVRVDKAMNDSSFEAADDSDLDGDDPYYCPWLERWVKYPEECEEWET